MSEPQGIQKSEIDPASVATANPNYLELHRGSENLVDCDSQVSSAMVQMDIGHLR